MKDKIERHAEDWNEKMTQGMIKGKKQRKCPSSDMMLWHASLFSARASFSRQDKRDKTVTTVTLSEPNRYYACATLKREEKEVRWLVYLLLFLTSSGCSLMIYMICCFGVL